MHAPDTANKLFQLAAAFVNQTHQSLFLTGKAGTGKTTFLKHIREVCKKNMVVTAPTGVAAINAGGVTLHSFFQLPVGTFLPETGRFTLGTHNITNKSTLFQSVRLNKEKIALINNLELLIIDEISMVRADMIDAVDTVLRHFRKCYDVPFGGVQLLFIGDLYQLPPVVNNDEWELLRQHYATPFFFSAHAIREALPVRIELQKIYRQKEETFIALLNNIRNNEVRKEDLMLLEKCYNPGFQSGADNYITLTSHNQKANTINEQKLSELSGKVHTFQAETEGNFDEKLYPADKVLSLKEGAQIMFIKNDKGENRRYFNGKIGKVSRIDSEGIFVRFPDEETELLLEKESWKNVRYRHNEEEDSVEEEQLGEFKQFPVRLAWAITIHKSQGLTFDKAIIDAGASFAAGQVYVALSRLTSMENLVLLSRISTQNISCNPAVKAFMQNMEQPDVLSKRLQLEQRKYIHSRLSKSFQWDKLVDILRQYIESRQSKKKPVKGISLETAVQLLDALRAQQVVAGKFERQLAKILAASEQQGYAELSSRIEAGRRYFKAELDQTLLAPLVTLREELKGQSKVKKYLQDLSRIEQAVRQKEAELDQAALLAGGLMQGRQNGELLQLLDAPKTASTGPSEKTKREKGAAGSTLKLTLELYKDGLTISEISERRNLAMTTIEGHLAQLIRLGEIGVLELVEEAAVEHILKELPAVQPPTLTAIKEHLGDKYSFLQIKATLSHQQWLLEREKELAEH